MESEIYNMDNNWVKPITTRRYIHPPMAERMYTIWNEGKIIFGENLPVVGGPGYRSLESCGIWFVYGENDEQFDFKKSINLMNPNGIPVHGLIMHDAKLTFEVEAVSDICRKPTCFMKITISNETAETASEKFAVMVRSGLEHVLAFGSPDVYVSYAPDINVWKDLNATWKKTADLTVRDRERFVKFLGDASWNEEKGKIEMDVTLEAGESAEFYIAFGKGEAVDFDYDAVKLNAYKYWEKELTRLAKLSDRIKAIPEYYQMIQNLAVQLMQCFCFYVDGDYVFARQGGLQRMVWPWETIPVLESLDRIGNFDDYIEPVFDNYFENMQIESGEIKPIGYEWACVTSSVLYSFGRYTIENRKDYYDKYRSNAAAAFEWIKEKRKESASIKGCVPGLFPPLRSCDWREIFQAWGTTDAVNLQGMKMFVEAAEKYNDPDAKAFRAEYDDYYNTVRGIYKAFADKNTDSDKLRFPIVPDGDDQDLIDGGYPRLQHGRGIRVGIIKGDEIEKVFNYMKSEDLYRNGLYGHFDGNHKWYTTNEEFDWVPAWLSLGREDMAKEIIESQIKYSMTDEYYMLERYDDSDPYYAPWSPNASGNGRMIIMLLDYIDR